MFPSCREFVRSITEMHVLVNTLTTIASWLIPSFVCVKVSILLQQAGSWVRKSLIYSIFCFNYNLAVYLYLINLNTHWRALLSYMQAGLVSVLMPSWLQANSKALLVLGVVFVAAWAVKRYILD